MSLVFTGYGWRLPAPTPNRLAWTQKWFEKNAINHQLRCGIDRHCT
jgi:hypothetical protein